MPCLYAAIIQDDGMGRGDGDQSRRSELKFRMFCEARLVSWMVGKARGARNGRVALSNCMCERFRT